MDARAAKPDTLVRDRTLLRFPRGLAVRLALLYGTIFTIAAAVLVGLVSYTTIASMVRQRDADITSELDQLQAEMISEGGVPELIGEINKRESLLSKSQFVYALYDGRNKLLAGTPLMLPHKNGWFDIDSATGDPDDSTHTVRCRTMLLPEGRLLGVGIDTDSIDDVREFLVTASVIGLGATALLALLGGATLSWMFGRRLDRAANVCREIMSGDLSLRVPARAGGDEIDLLATSVNAMLDRIVALMDTLKQVTVDVAHDLRTPLTRLRQGLETTEQQAKSTVDYSNGLHGAIGQVDAILNTFEALLRIAEIEDGALRRRFVAVDLSAILQTVADAYSPPAEESGHRITSRIASGVSVMGDQNLLTQLFANLVANALRHTPTGTTISIELEARAGRSTVVIADDGPGIPLEDRQRVFQRFVRLEQSRTTPGNGLGLSLCAAIAQLHDVRIDLTDNRPGLRCTIAF
jgi:signal transduction histidine kinase